MINALHRDSQISPLSKSIDLQVWQIKSRDREVNDENTKFQHHFNEIHCLYWGKKQELNAYNLLMEFQSCKLKGSKPRKKTAEPTPAMLTNA